ncbi:MAG: hypothetical protein ACFFD1_08295 [Candidatus Thorarchaeota archaeon]
MSRYLCYFFYWYNDDDVLKIALDFDTQQKASEMLQEIYEELMYHVGEDSEPNKISLQLIEPYGLRPFAQDIWDQPLELFVSKYGNEFVLINLNEKTIGQIEHIRPQVINTIRPREIVNTSVISPSWPNRTKFELRLISSLVRWLQFTQKRNWLQIVPEDTTNYFHRVWQVQTIIPDSDSYTANWKVILPKNYPKSSPMLFLRRKDKWVIRNSDNSIRWINKDGEEFIFINSLNSEVSGWNSSMFLCDWILSGLWNHLARELKYTYGLIRLYQKNVGMIDQSTLLPVQFERGSNDENKSHLLDLAKYFTWYCQRIPEKANEILQKIKENIPNHEIYGLLFWEDIILNLDPVSFIIYFQEIYKYYLKKIENKTNIFSDEIEKLEYWTQNIKNNEIKFNLNKLIDKLKSYPIKSVEYFSLE